MALKRKKKSHKRVHVKKGLRLPHGYETVKAKTISHGESKDVFVDTGYRLPHGYVTEKGADKNAYYEKGTNIGGDWREALTEGEIELCMSVCKRFGGEGCAYETTSKEHLIEAIEKAKPSLSDEANVLADSVLSKVEGVKYAKGSNVDVSKIRKKLEKAESASKEEKRIAKKVHTRSERGLAQDIERRALKPGKRVSANGNTYYEYRPEHSDVSPKTRLAKGGAIGESEKFAKGDGIESKSWLDGIEHLFNL